MIEKIIEKLKDKNIAILGFGREGQSTYHFIRKYLGEKRITILDQKSISIDDSNVTLITGEDYLEHLEEFDLIIKTPGVSLKDIDLTNIEDKITSQLELLLEVNRKNIIGITGTKGKSTTSTLTYEVLKDQLGDVYLLGNIGVPVLDEIDHYQDNTTLVIEMSSHQLEFIHQSPHIACILNLYEDHLDHTGTIEKYHQSKLNIFKYQTEDDYAIYSDDNSYLQDYMNHGSYLGKKYTVRFDFLNQIGNSTRLLDHDVFINDKVVYHDDKRMILGDHNLKNIMFVLTIVSILGLDFEKAKSIISHFHGLKYRMEYIGKYHDIHFYNDTIATIPEATINAVKAIGNVDTLIFGGLDRGIDYQEFISFLRDSSIHNLICMPTTGVMIGKELENSDKNVLFVNTLEEAYEKALIYTNKEMSCLLSPAAASYEFFKNFEEKGKKFEEIVKNS
ncbi:MAG: UDP-N-acetylmuramoyl-L-alanine--D-glutamate ligase [Bacilli bacterium]|nr:UDP-N-acetylmuramoyl-L-alanine--D-glutamate ligase [Bacilli bacterium]